MTPAGTAEAALIGVALAMDALAASVALGAAGKKSFDWKKIVLTAGFFGFFQFFMPLVGFYGSSFAESIAQNYGKWIAGALLILIGGKMFLDRNDEQQQIFSLQKLTILAFATSIDALLIGISYRCMHHTSIFAEVIIIGIVTALISTVGCIVGRMSGKILGNHCTILGALVLIALGIKVIIFS